MIKVDPLRHLSVFSPHAFGNKRVDVIGAGATGSRIVLSLAKLGVENIHAWDFDVIEEHNIANQIFGIGDVGRKKVDALSEIVKKTTGIKIAAYDREVKEAQELGEVVFLLTDTMLSRKEIWGNSLKFKLKTKLMIETRMGVDNGRIYSLNPNKLGQIKAWEETLYEDDKTETSACGTSVTVGSTAEMISGLAVWQMIDWFKQEQGKEAEIDNEIIFSLNPVTVINRKF